MGLLLARQMSRPQNMLYSDSDVLRWCVGLADAITMLHAQSPQIIHRDIKVTCHTILKKSILMFMIFRYAI